MLQVLAPVPHRKEQVVIAVVTIMMRVLVHVTRERGPTGQPDRERERQRGKCRQLRGGDRKERKEIEKKI
jgi:hypothetical protein